MQKKKIVIFLGDQAAGTMEQAATADAYCG
jgi:hypothetical protein